MENWQVGRTTSTNRSPEGTDRWFPTKESRCVEPCFLLSSKPNPIALRSRLMWTRNQNRQDLEEAQSNHDDFRAWVLANVGQTQHSATSSGKEDSKGKKQSTGLPSIQEALSKASTYEEAYGFIEPFSTINELGGALQARSELSRKRVHGIRRVSHGIQRFTVMFLQVLQAFKGIVDIAGSANPGFLCVAYETLNILFTVGIPIRIYCSPWENIWRELGGGVETGGGRWTHEYPRRY